MKLVKENFDIYAKKTDIWLSKEIYIAKLTKENPIGDYK